MKQKTVWLSVTILVVVMAFAACEPGDPWRSTGSYPIDIFQEMHYNQSYKAQEPPRVSAPEGSIPVSGGYIPAPPRSEAADLENPLPVNQQTLERGALLYKQNCAMCHGSTGGGDGYVGERFEFAATPPALGSERIQNLAPGEAYASISNGFGAMPPFQGLLSEADRWALVALIEAPESERVALLQQVDNADLTGNDRIENEIDRVLRLNELRQAQAQEQE